MIHLDDDERRRRLVRRHHLDRSAPHGLAAVRGVVAMHSSDPVTPFLGAWSRVPGFEVTDLERALYEERRLWRLHAMRRTLWVVAADDAPMIIAAASADVAAAERRRLDRWLVEDDPEADPTQRLRGIRRLLTDAMADGTPARTAELTARCEALAQRITVGSGRWRQELSLTSRMLYLMAMDGDLVRGAPASWRSSQYAWSSASAWFDPHPAPWPGTAAAARAALAARWLARFGPAGTEDLRWWTGWTVARTRAALADVAAVEVDTTEGPAWVLADDTEPVDAPAGHVVSLLPGLDPTTMGWRRRRFACGPHEPALFDRNGNAGPTIWVDGRVVGGWAQRADGGVATRLLEDVGSEAAASIAREADALERWLGDDRVTPRFRTPLERELSA